MTSTPAITFLCEGCHLRLPGGTWGCSLTLMQVLPCPALRELSSLVGKDHWHPENENKGHLPQRSCQTLRLFMLNYTCHPKMCVARICRPILQPSAVRPSHSESTVSIQLLRLREKTQILFLSHYQSKNGTVTVQFSLYKKFNELHFYELKKKKYRR